MSSIVNFAMFRYVRLAFYPTLKQKGSPNHYLVVTNNFVAYIDIRSRKKKKKKMEKKKEKKRKKQKTKN